MTGISTTDQMSGLVMWWYDFGDRDGGGYSQGHRRSQKCSRRHSVYKKRAVFHVTGP